MPQRGFTLVEAAIVLVLLGILAALVVPALVSSTRHEKRQEGKEALLALRHAIVEWADAHNDTLPANLTSAQLPDTDIWGRAYAYRPFSSTISVCT
ncbi:MAG: prepilin-type N-terminal cleavage/methylation domain-containing protein, partial [Desulfomicrobiaceae bacterium]|nr:prepilin-type N-terminal cleavage/methylation domain-containing protein [Desulfomicrobiaceae bacterium]